MSEGTRDSLVDDFRQRRAGRSLHHRSEHVDGDRILPRDTRPMHERRAGNAPDVFLQGQPGLIVAVGDIRASVWPIRRLLKAIVEAGGMREQVANRDLRPTRPMAASAGTREAIGRRATRAATGCARQASSRPLTRWPLSPTPDERACRRASLRRPRDRRDRPRADTRSHHPARSARPFRRCGSRSTRVRSRRRRRFEERRSCRQLHRWRCARNCKKPSSTGRAWPRASGSVDRARGPIYS